LGGSSQKSVSHGDGLRGSRRGEKSKIRELSQSKGAWGEMFNGRPYAYAREELRRGKSMKKSAAQPGIKKHSPQGDEGRGVTARKRWNTACPRRGTAETRELERNLTLKKGKGMKSRCGRSNNKHSSWAFKQESSLKCLYGHKATQR